VLLRQVNFGSFLLELKNYTIPLFIASTPLPAHFENRLHALQPACYNKTKVLKSRDGFSTFQPHFTERPDLSGKKLG
jgi:hypothetical protein